MNIDDVVGSVDALLCEGYFHFVDKILEWVIMEQESRIEILLAYLTVTAAASEHLTNRSRLFKYTQDHKEATEELLRGLE